MDEFERRPPDVNRSNNTRVRRNRRRKFTLTTERPQMVFIVISGNFLSDTQRRALSSYVFGVWLTLTVIHGWFVSSSNSLLVGDIFWVIMTCLQYQGKNHWAKWQLLPVKRYNLGESTRFHFQALKLLILVAKADTARIQNGPLLMFWATACNQRRLPFIHLSFHENEY